jgi:hypothetical protein
MQRRPYDPRPNWSVKDLRKPRAVHQLAVMEARVKKAEQELAGIKEAIEILHDHIRAVQGNAPSTVRVGSIRQEQSSLAHSYAARRFELQREADLAEQRLETERRIWQDLKRRFDAAGY